jgi:hypothetical protein
MSEVKAFRTFIRIYTLYETERLSSNVKLTLHKALIRSGMTYACLGISSRYLPLIIAAPIEVRFSAPLKIFPGAHQSTICTQLSAFHAYTII